MERMAPLEARLDAASGASPYRGSIVERFCFGAWCIAVQHSSGESVLVKRPEGVVAIDGWICNPEAAASDRGGEGSSVAAKLADLLLRPGVDVGSVLGELRGDFTGVVVAFDGPRITVFRSFLGYRQLHFAWGESVFGVATELTQLRAAMPGDWPLNRGYISSLLAFGTPSPGATPVRGMVAAVPGHYYDLDPLLEQALVVPRAYWWPPVQELDTERKFLEAARGGIKKSVMRATHTVDLVGVLLSGGVDSNVVFAAAAEELSQKAGCGPAIFAFTKVFPGFACDESEVVARVLDRWPSALWERIDAPSVLKRRAGDLVEMQASCDGVLDRASLVVTAELYERAVSHGVRVLLSGDGGDAYLGGTLAFLADELDGGHLLRWLASSLLLSVRLPEPWRGAATLRAAARPIKGGLRRVFFRQGSRALAPRGMDATSEHALGPSGHPGGDAGCEHSLSGSWLAPSFVLPTSAGMSLLARLRHESLSPLVSGWEQLGARFGVEVRAPLLDLELVDLAFRLPGRLAFKGLRYKGLLRAAMAPPLPRALEYQLKKPHFNDFSAQYPLTAQHFGPPGEWAVTCAGFLSHEQLDSLESTEYHEDRSSARFGQFRDRVIAVEALLRRLGGSRS